MTIPDALEALGIHRSPVTWFCDAVEIGKGRVLALGFCGKGGGRTTRTLRNSDEPVTSEFLRVLVVRDVLWDKDGCDDARWCLNLKCPFNRVEPKHFKRYGVRSLEDVKKLHVFLEDAAAKLKLECKGSVAVYYPKPPLRLRRLKS
jgi:hypothetical protein